MKNVINKILEIDEYARQELIQAQKKKDKILSDTNDEVSAIRQQVLDRASGRVAKVEEFEKADADEKIFKIESKKQQTIQIIEKNFNDNHEAWEKGMYTRIIDGLNKAL